MLTRIERSNMLQSPSRCRMQQHQTAVPICEQQQATPAAAVPFGQSIKARNAISVGTLRHLCPGPRLTAVRTPGAASPPPPPPWGLRRSRIFIKHICSHVFLATPPRATEQLTRNNARLPAFCRLHPLCPIVPGSQTGVSGTLTEYKYIDRQSDAKIHTAWLTLPHKVRRERLASGWSWNYKSSSLTPSVRGWPRWFSPTLTCTSYPVWR